MLLQAHTRKRAAIKSRRVLCSHCATGRQQQQQQWLQQSPRGIARFDIVGRQKGRNERTEAAIRTPPTTTSWPSCFLVASIRRAIGQHLPLVDLSLAVDSVAWRSVLIVLWLALKPSGLCVATSKGSNRRNSILLMQI